MRSNFYSVPTDCPQRDERLGWTGDIQLFLRTACWNMDMAGYMTKWMRDVVDSRTPDGAATDVAPALNAAPGAPGWADAITVTPWNLLDGWRCRYQRWYTAILLLGGGPRASVELWKGRTHSWLDGGTGHAGGAHEWQGLTRRLTPPPWGSLRNPSFHM